MVKITTKKQYESLEGTFKTLLNDYVKQQDYLASQVNLGLMTESEKTEKIKSFENDLFTYDWLLFAYNVKNQIRDLENYLTDAKELTIDNEAESIITEVNETPPLDKPEYNFNDLRIEMDEYLTVAFKNLKKTCKSFVLNLDNQKYPK